MAETLKPERYTARMSTDNLDDLRNRAYWSRRKYNDLIADALNTFIADWKVKHPEHVTGGKVNQRPIKT